VNTFRSLETCLCVFTDFWRLLPDKSVTSQRDSTTEENPDLVFSDDRRDSHQTVEQSLLNRKRDVTMELLWVQQAIESRRNYLKVKENLI